ncbi:MAG: class I SAM-dependent methyltransferase [Saprospiraceae bacterium]
MTRYLYPILLLFFVSNNACTDTFDSGTRHPGQHTHGYGNDHDHEEAHKANSRLQEKYQETDFRTGEGGNRWIWQKPNAIIEKLQPLEGKVVADIGAGPYGYFAFRIVHQADVAKVIAIDIDPTATKFMNNTRELLSKDIQDRVETRLVPNDDPQLSDEEADVVLIVNTVAYINGRIDYFKKIHKGTTREGKVVIVDFKKRNTPVGPPSGERVSSAVIERELKAAGYDQIEVDDRALEYQYVITARKGRQG